jgi:hypothetical protein
VDLQKWKERILYYPGSLLLLAWLPGYLKFKQDLNDPMRAQQKKLLDILGANQNTEYGKKYRFDKIKSIKQFQEQVPIVDYHAIRDEVQRMLNGAGNVLTHQEPFFFLITSGTTGEPKYIPVTRDFAKDYNSHLCFLNLLRHHPKIAYFNAILSIVTSDEEVTGSGLPVGASSGYLYRAQSPLAQLAYTLPYEIFAIDDWDAKYYTILRMSMEKPIRLIITNNPSSLIVLAKKAAESQERLLTDLERGTLDPRQAIPQPLRRTLERKLRPNPHRARRLRNRLNQEGNKLNPGSLWPELEALCCWVDGPARFYLPQLKRLYGNIPVHNLGYLASEGRGSVPLDDNGDCVLAIHSHFFEFIPVGEESSAVAPVFTCDQLESGQDYSILFTSSNGLYRYHINDIIRVKGFRQRTPVIQFQYKAGNTFDFTGEKLYATQIESSMERVLQGLKLPVVDYTVIPTMATPPFYRVVVECGPGVGPGLLENFAQEFESELIRGNISYAGKLASQLIGPLRLASVPTGTFENFFKYQVLEAGAPYSQVKIGHLNPSTAFLEYLKTNSLLPDDYSRCQK